MAYPNPEGDGRQGVIFLEKISGLTFMRKLIERGTVATHFRQSQVMTLTIHEHTSWRRKWQPTPVFLPGESQGRGSLMGCRLWGRTKSNTTEAT